MDTPAHEGSKRATRRRESVSEAVADVVSKHNRRHEASQAAMAALGRAASNKHDAQAVKVDRQAFGAARDKYADEQTAWCKISGSGLALEELTAYQAGIIAGWRECLHRLNISGVVEVE